MDGDGWGGDQKVEGQENEDPQTNGGLRKVYFEQMMLLLLRGVIEELRELRESMNAAKSSGVVVQKGK